MGLARLALTIGSQSTTALCNDSLEELIRDYRQFAYLDKRSRVAAMLSTATNDLAFRYDELCADQERFENIVRVHPSLQSGMTKDDLLRWQYGGRTSSDSGVFP